MHPILRAAMAAAIAASAASTPARAQSRDVLVVANQGDNTIHLVEAATGRNLAIIPTSPAPHEVAVSRDGRWAVVTNYVTPGSPPGHTLQVIDVPALKVARVIELGRYIAPHDVEFLPGDSMLAVTSEATRNIVLVDFASGEVKGALATNANGSHMIAFTADGGRIFSANVHGGTATEIDVAGARVVRTYEVGPGSEGLALTPDGKQLWVASLGQSNTTIFDTGTGAKIATIATPGHPYRVTITPDGRKALIPAPMANLLRVIDVATRAEETIAIEGGPGGAVVAADGRTVYVPLVEKTGIAVVDLQTKRVLRTLPSGAGPDGIGIARIGG